MTLRVREFKDALARLARNDRTIDTEMLAQINHFLEQISVHDDMELSAFFKLFKPKQRRATGATGRAQPTQKPVAAVDAAKSLDDVLESDAQFDAALARLKSNKAVTKPILMAVYGELFGSTAGVPKRATRAELLRLIADERLIAVRDTKTMRAMRKRPVPAE